MSTSASWSESNELILENNVHHTLHSSIYDSWVGSRNTVDVHGDIVLRQWSSSDFYGGGSRNQYMVMENNKKCRWESIKQQPRITKRIMLKMAVLLLSRKYQSQHCQYRRDNIAYLDNCWGRGRSERRIYDFAGANDLGLQQRTELGEGSECNLLN